AHSRVLSTVMTISRPPGLGIEDADFGQIQGDFNLRRHCFDPPLWFRGAEACHSPTVDKRPQNAGAPTRVPKEPVYSQQFQEILMYLLLAFKKRPPVKSKQYNNNSCVISEQLGRKSPCLNTRFWTRLV